MMINPKFTRSNMPFYKDSYDLGSDSEKQRKWQDYITAFLDNDNGYPPNTLVAIYSYERNTELDEDRAEVEEEGVFVNLTPQDAISFAYDILRLVSGIFDTGNHAVYIETQKKPKKKNILRKKRKEFERSSKKIKTD